MTEKQIQSMTGDILFIQILEIEPWNKTELPTFNDAIKAVKEYINRGYENPWKASVNDFKKALESVYKYHSTGPGTRHRYIIFNDDEKVFYVGERAEQ